MPVVLSAKAKRFLNAYAQAQKFRSAIPAAEQAAAATATAVSRQRFVSRLSGRPPAPTRPGRLSTSGAFASEISWIRTATGGGIEFELARLPFYALIQEIGTGQSAAILNPRGSITVRSQVGRTISANLYWASGPGAAPSRAQRGVHSEQLYYASELNAQAVAAARRRRKRIRREIKGKHFIGDGGAAGYVELRTRLTDEARRIFR